nr:hypothetical protein [uncultured Clostridium sp.]
MNKLSFSYLPGFEIIGMFLLESEKQLNLKFSELRVIILGVESVKLQE